MFHLDGSLTSVDDRVRTRLEAAIAECTGTRVRARGSCDEYWVVGRRALDQLLLCHRLDRPRMTRPVRGALSPELSALLVAASRPSPDDVFLDPFGGTGALVAARLSSPARTIIYSDIRKPSNLQHAVIDDRRVHVLTEDATELPSIPTGSVTAIVTDPPWGEHEIPADSYKHFATRTFASFHRVLDPHRGRLVLVTSRRTEPLFREALGGTKVEVGDTHRILVNGHPASVLLADAGASSSRR